VISDDLLQQTEGEIRANRRGTIRELHHIIPEVSKTAIHEAVTKKNYGTETCAHAGSQNVNGQSQNETDGFCTEVSHALCTGR
jgi:fructose-1,6-bisphosphatase